MAFSHFIWNGYGWAILIPLMVAWPLVIIPRLPVPEQAKTRRAIASFLTIILFSIACLVLVGMCFPFVDLIHTVSGPQ